MDRTDKLKTLDDLGFEPAGEWVLDNGRPAPELAAGCSNPEALYAFVESGDVVFIGREREAFGGSIDAGGPLGMVRRYATDNDRRIIEALMGGRGIEIRALAPSEPMAYRGWRINIGAGIRDALVRRLQPEWNRGGGQKNRAPF